MNNSPNPRRVPDPDLRIETDGEGFHSGREALELARFVPEKTYARVADLGGGDGTLSVLLARRAGIGEIWAFELDAETCGRAERNVASNHLTGRIRVFNQDIRKLQGLVAKSSFQLAIMNPPFFAPGRDFPGGSASERRSRQELNGGLPAFLQAARYLLAHDGDLVILYHPSRLDHLFCELARTEFRAKELQLLHHRDGRALFVMTRAVKGGREGLRVLPPVILPETLQSTQDAL